MIPAHRDILKSVHPPGCSKRWIMAVRFYGDESEDKDSKVLSIAGFLGFAEDWDALQEKWIARVKPTGVSAYHMTDCDNGWGEFSKSNGWTALDRRQLTIDLIEIVTQHRILMIGLSMLLDDYRNISVLPGSDTALGGDKWHALFQGILMYAVECMGAEAPPEETIAFFFDWKQKQGGANFFFDNIRNEKRLSDWRTRLGTLTFGHKEFNVHGSVPIASSCRYSRRGNT